MKIVTGIFFVLCTSGAVAQTRALDRIESARIALITERLALTPEQAEKFWPLYREYTERRRELRREFLSARSEVRNQELTDEESEKLIEKGLDLKERQLALDREYSEKFSKVITAQQILQLRKAEDDFRQMLLDRLEERRGARDLPNRGDERKGK